MRIVEWVPNMLTVLRMGAGFVVPLYAAKERWLASLIWAVGGFSTDLIDGELARRFGAETPFGKITDPIADVILDIGMITGAVLTDVIGWWLAFGLMVGAVFLRLPAYLKPESIWYKIGFLSGWIYIPAMLWYVVWVYLTNALENWLYPVLIGVSPLVVIGIWLKRERIKSDIGKLQAIIYHGKGGK